MRDQQNSCSPVGRRFVAEGKRGTVLFEGPVGDTKGVWLGVEWDDVCRGKHDGSHKGVRYFQPTSSAGTACSFLRHDRVDFGTDVLQGVKQRYGRIEGETAGVGQADIDELQKEIGARFVQVCANLGLLISLNIFPLFFLPPKSRIVGCFVTYEVIWQIV